MAGESVGATLIRETREELGIVGAEFQRLYSYIMNSEVERELVTTFLCSWDGPVEFPPEEVEEVAFYTPDEIETALGTGLFTPNFEDEWNRYNAWSSTA